jgi:hypothetical protein
VRFLFVFLADPSFRELFPQPFFHGEPPPTERLIGEKKADSRGRGRVGRGKRSSIVDNYFREYLFVKSVCLYCKNDAFLRLSRDILNFSKFLCTFLRFLAEYRKMFCGTLLLGTLAGERWFMER